MSDAGSLNLHATTVALDGRAVLIEGPSGAGKSDLALRLIDRGWALVADDRTLLAVRDGRLHASPPDRIAGMIEVRGIGIVDLPHRAGVPVALAVTLAERVDRLPEPAARTLLGIAVPHRLLAAHEPSAPIKVELALGRVTA